MHLKISHIPLALALAAAAPAFTAANPQGDAVAAKPQAAAGAQSVDAALDQVATKARQSKAAREDFEQLKAALKQRSEATLSPDAHAGVVTARLERCVDALEERSKAGKLEAKHIDMLREQLVDERIDKAIERLSKAVTSGKVAATDYQAVAAEIARRAEVSRSFDKKSDELRARLQASLGELEKRAKTKPLTSADVSDYHGQLTELRIDHAIGVLEACANAGDLTPCELQRVRGMLEDHAAHAQDDAAFAAMRERMDAALADLETRARSGKVAAADVAKLREHLDHAREASNDKPSTPPKR